MDNDFDSLNETVLNLSSIGFLTNKNFENENNPAFSTIKKINSFSKNEDLNLNKPFDCNSIILDDKSIYSLKNSIILQESTDLHWFTEDSFKDYENKNQSEISFESSDQLYHAYSRDIDANLAEIDMDTFRTEDINTIYVLPKSRSSQNSFIKESPKKFDLVSSSFFYKLHPNEKSLSSIELSNKNHCKNEFIDSNNKKPKQEIDELASRLSLDSLDLSSYENDTNELVMRCRMQDKTKYTIAFEESSLTTFSDFNHEKNDYKDISSRAFNNFMNREMNTTKSDYCYTTWNRLKSVDKENIFKNSLINLRKFYRSKHSQSLPNIGQIDASFYSKEKKFNFINDYTSSSLNSDLNASRLIRYFIQNKLSLFNSPLNSCNSFEKHSEENNINGKVSANIFNCNFSSFGSNSLKKANKNDNINTQSNQEIEDSFEDNLNDNIFFQTKTSFNRMMQTSPIKEEEEPLTDSSKADVIMTSETDDQTLINCKCTLSSEASHPIEKCKSFGLLNKFPVYQNNLIRRNSGHIYNLNGFKNLRHVGCKEFGSTSSGYQSSRHGSVEWVKKMCLEPQKPKFSNNIFVSKLKSIATQIPVHIQDKKVQTNDAEFHSHFISTEYNSQSSKSKLNDCSGLNPYPNAKKTFYVCYPNYSLPDLNFLTRSPKNLQGPLKNNATNVYLSLTKVQPPEPNSGIKYRLGEKQKGVRPKSFTDYESLLTNQSFDHIKDLDSLNVLLPSQYKPLIARLKEVKLNEEKTLPNPKSSVSQDFNSQIQNSKNCLRKFCSFDNSEQLKKKKSQRHSLQESFDCLGSNLAHRTKIIRSATMPTCSCFSPTFSPQHFCCHHQLNYHQNFPQHTQHCHHPYHKQTYQQPYCPSTHQLPQCCQHSNQSINHSLETDLATDELSHLISMDMNVKQVTNIINGHKPKFTSPSNPYDPICEQSEENDSNNESEITSNLADLKTKKKDLVKFKNLKKNCQLLPLASSELTQKEELKYNLTKFNSKPQQNNLTNENLLIKKVIRPTSLPTQSFKSLIPIAKGLKSPGLKLTSPTQGFKVLK